MGWICHNLVKDKESKINVFQSNKQKPSSRQYFDYVYQTDYYISKVRSFQSVIKMFIVYSVIGVKAILLKRLFIVFIRLSIVDA